jgi:aminoglycoside phosphotransferase (APT) family kinase protein
MPTDGADSAAVADFQAALIRMGLVSPAEVPRFIPLTGGVSSDIVRADLAIGSVCIKRALSKLKVKANWEAPIERNRWEVEWMRTAGAIVPRAVPRILGADAASGMFAMEYLAPEQHPVWKVQLRDGGIDPSFAAQVGSLIGSIHAQTAARGDVAARFATDHIFFPIRLEPYLAATARAHPDCAPRLRALIDLTLNAKRALVHGDVSPKNILRGPYGPVFLDAECAWYGDPAFDLAFCLNHMLLKCVWRPQWSDAYLACFDALSRAYLDKVTWEPAPEIEARAAHLLPGLLLARVDGKSPVEYITDEWQRVAVRTVARALLLQPVDALSAVRGAWATELHEPRKATHTTTDS